MECPEIAEECRRALRVLISENAGCEVFVIGSCDAAGKVVEVDPLAFGNWDAVPAPAQNARPGQVLIHNHPSGVLDPSKADIDVASMYGQAGIGFYIIDNDAGEVRVVVKPFKAEKRKSINPDDLMSAFGPEGTMSRAMPGFEFRPQQIEMLELVANAFNNDHVAVVEAGTGTGKSFAYLAPGIAWSLANKRRLIVSTNTINLQEQLIEKDLPALAAKLGWKFHAVLMKGRSNYISMRRLKHAERETDMLIEGRGGELKQVSAWAAKTRDGSRSDLPIQVSDELWEAVMSDKDDCLRAACPHFDACFYYKSRREAAAADVIVANHHLVMADIAIKMDNTGNDFMAIIPPYERIVFDEAHHLDDVATSYFSSDTSLLAIRRQLLKLVGMRHEKGWIPKLRRSVFDLDSANLYPPTRQILSLLDEQISNARSTVDLVLESKFEELFRETLAYFSIRELPRRERRELRITEPVMEAPYWKAVKALMSDIANELNGFLKPVEKALNLLKFFPEALQKELIDVRAAAASAHSKLSEHATTLKFFLKATNEQYCRWFEVGYVRDRPSIRPCIAPLEVAPQLRKALFDKKPTVVLTSATLTVQDRFDFIAKALGLPNAEQDDAADQLPASENNPLPPLADRTRFLKLGTPFDYEKNCMVGVTVDLAPPNDPRFDEQAEGIIYNALQVTQGRAFVLFTSYRALEKVHRNLSEKLAADGMTPFRQGEMPRNRLLDAFRNSANAVLFATSSFWEGIDVPGRALESLILTKLPFSVPTTPILEARTERIDRLGGNSFSELTIPLAVIKFKQGFGRLIRSKSDRGTVLILDQRVVTKYYGKIFLRSLPRMRVVADTSAGVLQAFTEFYANEPEQV